MGIRSFYGGWVRKLNYFGLRANQLPPAVYSLMIDMNSVFHTVAQKVYAYGAKTEKMDPREKREYEERVKYVATADPKELEDQLFLSISARLEQIISYINPQEVLILAVDGVAPMAKINQQRNRRFLNARNRGPGNLIFDSNAITPGTDFMYRLDEYLRRWILSYKAHLPPLIVYSPQSQRGEGEHKIFEYLRAGILDDVPDVPTKTKLLPGAGANIVYGADADLIMLSSLSPVESLYLCREDVTEVLSIDSLRNGVFNDLTNGWEVKPSLDIVTQDFVIMVFLLGNDFLPHIGAFEAIDQSMGLMIATYNRLQLPLTDEGVNILWENLAKFFSILGEEYEADLYRRMGERKLENPFPALDEAITVVDVVKQKGALFVGQAVRKVKFDYNKFRKAWYKKSLGPKTEQGWEILAKLNINPSTELSITQMCADYLFGMQWILIYYTAGTEAITSRFVYPYFDSPLIRDLAKSIPLLKAENLLPTAEQVKATPEDPIFTPLEQMLSVFPPPSQKLIPKPWRELVEPDGPIYDLAPSNFQVEVEGDIPSWKGVAILPFVDPERVIDAVDEMNERLNLQRKVKKYENEEGLVLQNVVSYVEFPARRGRGRGEAPRGRGFQPQRGGFQPQRGGFQPQRGGFQPQRGGFQPQRGGFQPQRGGFQPQRGGFQAQRGRGVSARGPTLSIEEIDRILPSVSEIQERKISRSGKRQETPMNWNPTPSI